jgi:spermidine synthase
LTFVTAGRTTSLLEDVLYDDEIIHAETTPYQRLVVTRWRDDVRLFINGNIQLSSVDEYRYHETLVHPVMSVAGSPRRVLILGGGDGMAAREVLKHQSVERIDIVDLDPRVPSLFREARVLRDLNGASLADARVHVTAADAMTFLEGSLDTWDVAIIDLPDPNDEGIGKLYTRSFYRLVFKHLAPDGVMVTQATSPYYAADAFWCIYNTLAATTLHSEGGQVYPLAFRTYVPSFGEWGFVMAANRPVRAADVAVNVPTRYLSQALLPTLFVFSKDMGHRDTPVNVLNDQALIRLYRDGYNRFH